MASKKCNWCKNKLPVGGQCNKCGFVDGISRRPTEEEFRQAREINDKNSYKQFSNLDMLLEQALKH